MTKRYNLAWFILLLGLSATIFFFGRNEDDIAVTILFLTFYACVTAIYFLKILYYAQYKATLNEIYFFSFANLIPLVIFTVSPYIPLSRDIYLSINIEMSSSDMTLYLTIASILAFPYLVVSTALLMRSFTRYQFIRLTPQSTKGPSAEWIAIFTFFLFGGLFIWAGLFASDLLGVLYGLFFLFSGLGFLLGK